MSNTYKKRGQEWEKNFSYVTTLNKLANRRNHLLKLADEGGTSSFTSGLKTLGHSILNLLTPELKARLLGHYRRARASWENMDPETRRRLLYGGSGAGLGLGYGVSRGHGLGELVSDAGLGGVAGASLAELINIANRQPGPAPQVPDFKPGGPPSPFTGNQSVPSNPGLPDQAAMLQKERDNVSQNIKSQSDLAAGNQITGRQDVTTSPGYPSQAEMLQKERANPLKKYRPDDRSEHDPGNPKLEGVPLSQELDQTNRYFQALKRENSFKPNTGRNRDPFVEQ